MADNMKSPSELIADQAKTSVNTRAQARAAMTESDRISNIKARGQAIRDENQSITEANIRNLESETRAMSSAYQTLMNQLSSGLNSLNNQMSQFATVTGQQVAQGVKSAAQEALDQLEEAQKEAVKRINAPTDNPIYQTATQQYSDKDDIGSTIKSLATAMSKSNDDNVSTIRSLESFSSGFNSMTSLLTTGLGSLSSVISDGFDGNTEGMANAILGAIPALTEALMPGFGWIAGLVTELIKGQMSLNEMYNDWTLYSDYTRDEQMNIYSGLLSTKDEINRQYDKFSISQSEFTKYSADLIEYLGADSEQMDAVAKNYMIAAETYDIDSSMLAVMKQLNLVTKSATEDQSDYFDSAIRIARSTGTDLATVLSMMEEDAKDTASSVYTAAIWNNWNREQSNQLIDIINESSKDVYNKLVTARENGGLGMAQSEASQIDNLIRELFTNSLDPTSEEFKDSQTVMGMLGLGDSQYYQEILQGNMEHAEAFYRQLSNELIKYGLDTSYGDNGSAEALQYTNAGKSLVSLLSPLSRNEKFGDKTLEEFINTFDIGDIIETGNDELNNAVEQLTTGPVETIANTVSDILSSVSNIDQMIYKMTHWGKGTATSAEVNSLASDYAPDDKSIYRVTNSTDLKLAKSYGMTATEMAKLSRMLTQSGYQVTDDISRYLIDASGSTANAKQILDMLKTANQGDIDTSAITSDFGTRIDPFTHQPGAFHNGIDFAASIGTTVPATVDGTARVLNDKLGGLVVAITDAQGNTHRFAHLSRALVNTGDKVTRGQYVAETGNSGSSTGPHLHYGVHNSSGSWINPRQWITYLDEGNSSLNSSYAASTTEASSNSNSADDLLLSDLASLTTQYDRSGYYLDLYNSAYGGVGADSNPSTTSSTNFYSSSTSLADSVDSVNRILGSKLDAINHNLTILVNRTSGRTTSPIINY